MSEKIMNRWMVVIGAILIQLCLGAIYAWSVFTPHLNPTLPKKDKETGEFKDMLVFVEQEDKLVAKTIPKETKPKDDMKVASFDVLGWDGFTAETLPRDLPTDASALTPAKVRVAVAKDYDVSLGLPVSRAEFEASQARFSKTNTQVVFAVGLAMFAIVMVGAGFMLPKVGPRKLAVAGGLVLGAGYALAGLTGATSFMAITLLVGGVGGAGIGLGYVIPIAVGMRWFPDKKGMITGLAVAGFGFGALGWVKMAGAWGNLLASQGLATTFVIYGVAFAALVLIGSIWMVFPPQGWTPAGYEAPEANKATANTPPTEDHDLHGTELLRTLPFYLIFLTFVFSAGAGLMTIGLMKLYPIEALKNAGMDAAKASAVAGTAMAVFFSLANGIGRIVWGTLSDKLGRKLSVILMAATQGVIVLAFTSMAGNEYLLYLGATLIGFNFGGNFALFPTITADTFGAKSVGQNYPLVFLAYGVGGIFGPILGGKLGDLGNFPLAFTICGVLCLAGAVLTACVKPRRH
jgi:OFA family oxalate/formate antiporter-like MFS transporter